MKNFKREIQNIHSLDHQEKPQTHISFKGKRYPSKYFFNRDLSWLDFNERVLNETTDKRNPTLERLRFIDIFRSNNDEFFMKRFSYPIRQKKEKIFLDGKSRKELHEVLVERAKRQNKLLQKNFQSVLEELNQHKICLLSWEEITKSEQRNLTTYFKKNIFPILTPLAVDSGRPFPFLSNLSKSIAVTVKKPQKSEKFFARIKIPSFTKQWVELPSNREFAYRFINIDEIIKNHLSFLFQGMEIENAALFRVTRFAAIEEDDEEPEDKMEWVEEELKERKFAPVIRLEVEKNIDPWIKDFLINELEIDQDSLFDFQSQAQYQNFSEIYDLPLKKLKFKKFTPSPPTGLRKSDRNIFQAIKRRDLLAHFPYHSFSDSVEEFVKQATSDPKVKAIKIILYRTDTNGKLINYLIEAAENKKQVACIIELKARFDEERNIKWAQKLEEAGVHVSYGLMDKKTHAKMIAVIRQDSDALRTYSYIGTGNFNSQTSRFYTDIGYFTAKNKIGGEVLELFNYLTGRSLRNDYQQLLVAPFTMAPTFKEMILREAQYAKDGYEAQIIAKMNQLEDPEIIQALYKASQAGVTITLYVRGFCCLKPQVKGLSENIRVYSVIGRLLEHSRIFYFSQAEMDPLNGKFYLGSADWMHRNLYDRVEVIVPLNQRNLKNNLWRYFEALEKDNENKWELQKDGSYKKEYQENKRFNSQQFMIEQL